MAESWLKEDENLTKFCTFKSKAAKAAINILIQENIKYGVIHPERDSKITMC